MVWRDVTIGKLGRVVTGRTPPSSQPTLFGDAYPFITPTDIEGQERLVNTERFLSEEGRASMERLLVPAGSIAYVCIASVGKVCVVQRPSFTNQQINSVVVDEGEFDPSFVYYALRHATPRIKGIAGGAATPIINKSAFSDISVRAPNLPSQRRIASILSAYDDLIENNTRRIAILEEMARRIYEEWFVRFRFPGHENVRMVESELGLVPGGWVVEPLAEICDVTDYVANGSFASLKENVTYCDEKDYAVLVRGTDFNSGWNGKYVYVTEHSYKFLRKSSLNPGDIVVTNVGNVGITFLVPDLAQPMTLGPNSVLARPRKGRMFMYFFLRSSEGQHRIKGITSGAAQPKFNKTEFRNLRIAIPPPEQLDRFDAVIGPFYLLSEKIRQSNTNLRATRDFLLPKLISGELDVSALTEPEAIAA